MVRASRVTADPAHPRPARGVDWNTPGNAEQYDRFTAAHPMYHVTSRALIALAGVAAARTIVDLCCGTGVSTEVALEAAPHARVIALDASASQLARGRITEPRVRFVEGPAEEVAGPADAVVCNAAVWQLRPAVMPAVPSLLGAGGRFAFNIPAPFAPEAVRAAAAAGGAAPPRIRFEASLERAMLDEARRRFGYAPPPAELRRAHPFARHFDGVEAQLHFDLFALLFVGHRGQVPAGFELRSLYDERHGLREILAAHAA